jgi:hypothetical protein
MSDGTTLKYTKKKKSVINIGTKIYNLPGFIKETDNYYAFKKELKQFLLLHTFYSVEESASC